MQKQSNWRIRLVSFVILFLTSVLIFSGYRLQIQYHRKYVLISNKNRIRVTPIVPKRGRIITSDGVVIARDVNRYKLMLSRCSNKDFEEAFDFIKKNISITESEIQRITEEHDQRRVFITIKDDLSWEEYVIFAINAFRMNHLFIEKSYTREYSDSKIFCHVTGYTAKNRDELRTINGKTGIEAFFNEKLSGSWGRKQTEVNAHGKVMRTLNVTAPTNGEDITITINSDLQKFVYDTLAEHKAGGCIVLDMKGNILAMVSCPGFDTNLLSQGMNKAQWSEIRDDPLVPMINRVTSAYPPGSIFKIVMALAALNEGVVSPKDKIFCSGGVKQDNHVFHCWNRSGHGHINIIQALQHSCDCYFFEVAKKLGIEKIAQYAKKFGFGTKIGIETTGENAGLLPTKKWKEERHHEHWKPYETMIAGIGQGYLLSTLVQTATMFGRLYSNENYTPTLIAKNTENNPKDILKYCDVVRNALHLVCTSGTAAKSCNAPYGISGKTGSSQVRKLKNNEAGKHQSSFEWKYRDHAFFGGVAPTENPQYIVVVFVEHGGGGGSVAAPIARKIFDKLMKNTAQR